ncbi:MAG: DJ-1/PfpI family protein [Alphaproteobacteria bacterium]|jgi:cyclohexyl-isocyanide hydratase|nr:DJ-1/PfpI family protein [Alphaproteobacteria bacterium]
MPDSEKPRRIAMVLFPGLTQLDLTGPFEVLARLPGAKVDLVSSSLDPVETDRGLILTPSATYTDLPDPDVLFVPGGPGQLAAMEDTDLIAYLKAAGEAAELITSVCTGSLLLAAAGLLRGKRATTHWAAIDQLALLGAIPVEERVVEDGNVITGAGVTSGIDFALLFAARVAGEEEARRIQLQIEYDPAPPFPGGSPASADPADVAALRERGAALREKRIAVATRLGRELEAEA